MAAWNADDLEAWLDTQEPAVEYVSLASGAARVYSGHEGMRAVWDESRANWESFRFTVRGDRDGRREVGFAGVERLQRTEIDGVLWFRAEERDGRIARLWSALDAGDLP